MRLAVPGALFLGLLIATDLTYLGASRSLSAINAYRDHRVKETWAIQAEATRRLTDEERNTQTKASGLLSQVLRNIEDWQGSTFLALGFLAYGLIWLTLITISQRATQRGFLFHGILKGSMIGALAIGTCFTCFLGAAFWLAGEDRRTYDRYEWEVRWLMGAIGGAVVGALIGLLAGAVLKFFRRNQNSGKAAVQVFQAASGKGDIHDN